MNTIARMLVGLLVGIVAFLIVAVGVTEALAATVGFSILVGLPAGIVTGVTVATATYALLWVRDRPTTPTPKTTGVVYATAGALVMLVATIGGAAVLFAVDNGSLGILALWYGLPVSVVVAAVAGYLVGTATGGGRNGPVPR